MAIRNIVGNIPEPDELYGRKDLISHLWRQISGNNILLLAPRRFGKTGVMRHILLKPRPDYLPIYLDLEDVDSPEEFLWRITRELLTNNQARALLLSLKNIPHVIGEYVKDNFDEIEFEGAKVSFKKSIINDWRTTAKRLLLEMEKTSQTTVFILDELTTPALQRC